jgi:hypothetical protein
MHLVKFMLQPYITGKQQAQAGVTVSIAHDSTGEKKNSAARRSKPGAHLVEVQRYNTNDDVHAHQIDDADVQGEEEPSERGAGLRE